MKAQYVKDAVAMLEVMIRSQPGLIHPHHASEDTGRLLADFCAAFVSSYAENLERIQARVDQAEAIAAAMARAQALTKAQEAVAACPPSDTPAPTASASPVTALMTIPQEVEASLPADGDGK